MQQTPAKLITVAIICLLLGLCLGLIINKNNQSKPTPYSPNQAQGSQDKTNIQPAPVMAVEAINPIPKTINMGIYANGTIVGKELAEVSSRVSGVAIERVLVDVGDWVNQGQVLAILDNQSLNQDSNALKAELRQAHANLEKASADLARIEPLLAIDAISRQQYDNYKTAKIQAAASVDAINARLANLTINQKRTQVVAPVSGIIAERFADVGMIATGNKLFTIIKNGTLEWQASVKADNADNIKLGQVVNIQASNNIATAEVTRISPTVNASRELTVYARLLETKGLKSGMFQSGQILVGEQNVKLLPQKAIIGQDGYDYVWQLKETANSDVYQVHKHKVNLGDYHHDGVVVDLPADMQVVAQGGNFLNDGDIVKVTNLTNLHSPSTNHTTDIPASKPQAGEGL